MGALQNSPYLKVFISMFYTDINNHKKSPISSLEINVSPFNRSRVSIIAVVGGFASNNIWKKYMFLLNSFALFVQETKSILHQLFSY